MDSTVDKSLVRKFCAVPPGHDNDLIPSILNICRNEKIEMMIPTVDEELLSISANIDIFKRNGIVVFSSDLDTVKICQDKYLTFKEFNSKGIPVPTSWLPSELYKSRLVYPVLVKPRVGRGGRGITVAHSDRELKQIQMDDSYIVQEFASGQEYDTIAFVHNRNILELRLLKKTRLEHGEYGNALEAIEAIDEDVAKLSEKVLSSFAFAGPIDMDIRRLDGKPVVLEVNPRVSANIYKVRSLLDRMISIGATIIGSI